jgi:hypothetical protein
MGTFRHMAVAPVLLLLFCSSPVSAATLVRTKGPATLTLTARKVEGDRLLIRLSDIITAHLSVETAAAPKVEVAALTPGAEWLVEPKSPPDTRRLEDGKWRWSYTLLIEPNQKDELKLPIPALKYREGNGKWKDVNWDPVSVVVTTQIPKADASLAKDITGIEEVPPADLSWFVPIMVAVWSVVGCLLLLVASKLLRRKRRPAAVERPEEQARRELLALRAAIPTTPEQVEPFHTRLSAAVKTYVARSRHVPARQHTSAELVALLAEKKLHAAEDLDALRDFFRRCDLGKFAPLHLAAEECEKTLALAAAFVEKTAANLDNPAAKPEDRQ